MSLIDSMSVQTAGDSIAALRRDGYDFIKVYAWPHPLYDTVAAAAKRVGLRIVGHVRARGTKNELVLEEALRDRWASIEHLTGYLGYITGGFTEVLPFTFTNPPERLLAALETAAWMRPGHQWDPAKLRAIAITTRDAGTWNCPTLAAYSHMYTADGADSAGYQGEFAETYDTQARWASRMMDFMFQMTKALQDNGAGLLAGTDAGGGGIDQISEELRVMVIRAGLTPYQALATATRNPAAFLGTLDSAGTIAVGKRADLVLLNNNPLRDITATTTPAGTMFGGQWLPQP